MEKRIKEALLERGLIADEGKDLIIKTAKGKEVSITELVLSMIEPAGEPKPGPGEPIPDTRAEQMARDMFIGAYIGRNVQDGEVDTTAEHYLAIARRFYAVVDNTPAPPALPDGEEAKP